MKEQLVHKTPILTVEKHPNADRLDIVTVLGYQAIVKRKQFNVGDVVVFIEPDAVLSEETYTRFGVGNYLASLPKGAPYQPNSKRVKAARLRGIPSYGLIVELTEDLDNAENIQEYLSIEKWEPPLKAEGADALPEHTLFHHYTKIQNWRKYPDIFKDDEEVVISEKIHGTNCRIAVINGELLVGSHRVNLKENPNNIYWRAALENPQLVEKLKELAEIHKAPIIAYGEVYGDGVQDMVYGLRGKTSFVAFDIAIGTNYMNYDDMVSVLNGVVDTVPILYRGPYSRKVVEELTDGPTTMTDDPKCKFTGREGIVIKPVVERSDIYLDRVILKSISCDYLDRKGGTDSH